jgi:hypothetical protein
MDEGARLVISLLMRSAMPGNMVVPPAGGEACGTVRDARKPC